MTRTLRLVDFGGLLGTRHLGASVRGQIESGLRQADKVEIDFAGVETVSHSFADEAFGKLVAHIGPEVLKQRIVFKGVDPTTAPLLRLVLSRRAPGLVGSR